SNAAHASSPSPSAGRRGSACGAKHTAPITNSPTARSCARPAATTAKPYGSTPMPEVWTSEGVEWREFKPFDPETAPLPAPAAWWKRLPIIRHVRWLAVAWRIERHYGAWASLGRLPVYRAFDERCLKAILRGEL